MLNFENTFAELPNNFFARVKPSFFPNPKLIVYNEALSKLLKIDPNWNEQAARKQLIEFFQTLGLNSEEVKVARRQLSSILFS